MADDFNDEDVFREDEDDYDIIIIGAGLAGLTCAYNILKRNIGLDVLIIEANSEVGGRILSNGFSGSYHANFAQKHITNLARTLELNIDQGKYENGTNETILYTKGKSVRILPKLYGADVYHFLETIKENASDPRLGSYTEHEDAKNLAETSVEQFLREIIYIPYARSLCRAYLCSTCAVRNLNNISALWFMVMLNNASGFLNRWKTMTGDSKRYFIQGGMSKITKELLNNILREQGTIRYVDPVSEITYNDDRVYVQTEKAYFRCRYVVIAIPPSIMNHITIEPCQCPLATETLYTPGENVFFNIVYKEPLCSDNSVESIVTTWDSNSALNMVYNATHSSEKKCTLAGFLTKPHLVPTQGQGLLDTLNNYYGIGASQYLQYKEYDESLVNDHIKAGCPMSAMKPCSIDKHINCTGISYGRVFFASSDYAANWPGTVDGAIQSGEITAYEILLRLRPQALTSLEISSFGAQGKKKIKQEDPIISIKMNIIQCLGIIMNVAVFLSFLRVAYN